MRPTLSAHIDAALSIYTFIQRTTKTPSSMLLDALVFPDDGATFRPKSQLYYMGSSRGNGHAASFTSGRYKLHPDLSASVAEYFQIDSFSSLELGAICEEDPEDDMDMEETLTTRISNVLRQYLIEASLTEMLANAIDAKASEFHVVVVDTIQQFDRPVLSPAFVGPMLIVHNDSTFLDGDWAGLRNIGHGGKEDRPESIGRFGLGALSIYHFAEVCIWKFSHGL
jgi:sacsin